MMIVDSQIHLWNAGSPGGTHQASPFSMEDALRGMDEAGVDSSVIVPPPWDPDANEIALDAARRHPDRFAVVGHLALDQAESRAKLETGQWHESGMRGVRVAFSQPEQRPFLVDGTADWLWSHAELTKTPVMVFAPGSLEQLERVADRHPGLKLCVDHMGLVTGTRDANAFEPVLPQLAALAQRPNVTVKLSSAPISLSAPYPFRNISDYLCRIFDASGPARSFWGSDITRLPC